MNSSSEGDVIGYVFTSLGIIGAVALLLSTAGIYALVSFTLARRRREIGIRTALGDVTPPHHHRHPLEGAAADRRWRGDWPDSRACCWSSSFLPS